MKYQSGRSVRLSAKVECKSGLYKPAPIITHLNGVVKGFFKLAETFLNCESAQRAAIVSTYLHYKTKKSRQQSAFAGVSLS